MNFLLTRAKRLIVLGLPHYHYQPERTKEVNALLASRREFSNLRGIFGQVYSDKHLRRDKVHLISDALNGIIYNIKGKIVYNYYRPELELEGHPQVIECCEVCVYIEASQKYNNENPFGRPMVMNKYKEEHNRIKSEMDNEIAQKFEKWCQMFFL